LEPAIRSLPGGLSFNLTEGGENFSQGQRQLICLARALIRTSRIVLLDEATSSVDYNTDAIIQSTLRDEFGGGKSTILCVAHRLSTIMDTDKVLVMSDGKVVEFDSPERLLRLPNSLFSELVAATEMSDTSMSR
jgi:ABC-type multidrug transport system fused ATPase/permease subunit